MNNNRDLHTQRCHFKWRCVTAKYSMTRSTRGLSATAELLVVVVLVYFKKQLWSKNCYDLIQMKQTYLAEIQGKCGLKPLVENFIKICCNTKVCLWSCFMPEPDVIQWCLYVRKTFQSRIIFYQIKDMLNAVSRDVVAVEIQILQSGVVAQRCGDAFQT